MPRFAVCDGTGTACRAPTCTSFFIALHIGWGGMTPPLRGTISHGTLCGLRRNGHGMPCPYTHHRPYTHHILWHAWRMEILRTDMAWSSIPVEPSREISVL